MWEELIISGLEIRKLRLRDVKSLIPNHQPKMSLDVYFTNIHGVLASSRPCVRGLGIQR